MVMNLPTVQWTQVWSLNWEDPWRKEWQPSPVFLPGEFHGQSSVVGYSPWCCKELGTTEWLTLSLFIIQRSTKWNKKKTKKPHHLLTLRYTKWDFPGGLVVKNLPASAESMGLIPWSGKSPHAVEQLSLCMTTTEALPPYSLCSATGEALALQLESSLCSP